MITFTKKYAALCILLFILGCILIPDRGFTYDIQCWQQWTEYIAENGLGNAYHSNTDYPPLIHYILLLLSKTPVNVENGLFSIQYLKLFTFVFHFITGLFIAWMIKREEKDLSNRTLVNIGLFYLLNIAILYNTVAWGQVDAILTCFVFISCFYAIKKRVTLSLVFMVLAINFKIQAIIFIPVIGLLILPQLISSRSVKNIASWIFIPLCLQLLILLPFIMTGTLSNIWAVVSGSVGKWPVVSINAFNLWNLVLAGKDLRNLMDNQTFLTISYKNWGLMLFFISSAVAMLPLAKNQIVSILKNTGQQLPLEKILLTCSLIPLLFFFFNTQMHERYAYPALVFIVAYSIYFKKQLIGILGSCAIFLNQEAVFGFLNLSDYHLFIFNPLLISCLYLLTIALLYKELFRSSYPLFIK